MNYSAFPSQRPDNTVLTESIKVALGERFTTRRTTTGMMDLCRSSPDGLTNDVVCHLPHIYAQPLLQLLYRRYALAVVLDRENQLDIKPYSRWLVLAQNLLYLDLVWNRLQDERASEDSVGPHWRSFDFDRFVATEVIVRRHEPVYVNAYRRQREEDMPNISQVTIDDLGV